MPFQRRTYDRLEASTRSLPNIWDMAAIVLVTAALVLITFGAKNMASSYALGQKIPISLAPNMLPYYALRTVIRMLIALCVSLLFTFTFGTWAAKSRQAEQIIIPAIDVLQSVPVLGFLSITVLGFIHLFPGSMMGPECAAIFAIFTAQAWNMALSFYQSLRTVPKELQEAASMFQLSAWQRFWKIEVPFAMPGLLWNAMMSMSGSWVFLVASEAISVGNQTITLPGIGSYIAQANLEKNWTAIGYVILAVLLVIALYDQILFRPLVAWSEKFKSEQSQSENTSESWVLNLFQRARITPYLMHLLQGFTNLWINNPLAHKSIRRPPKSNRRLRLLTLYGWYACMTAITLLATGLLLSYLLAHMSLHDIAHVAVLGLITGLKVMLLIFISSLIWVPVGVLIGLNPKAARLAQPLVQFFAAFPANLLFGALAFCIITYHLNVNIWTAPLMILGTQWYILFNVIAGTTAIPENLRHATATLCLTRTLWWKRLALPAIFPYYITGAITAAGGAWNMSIIAEAVTWGHHHLYATGLGAYIAQTNSLNHPRMVLGIVMMALYVVVINRVLWRPLYRIAETRFQLD